MLTDQTTNVTDSAQHITPPELDAEMTAITRKWAKQRLADEQARRDPVLRVAMVKLITQLEQVLADVADAAALENGGDDAFSADEMRELMIWQLAEFINHCTIERGDDEEVYAALRKWYELDERHALTWFDVTYAGSNWQLVALEDADRTPTARQRARHAQQQDAANLPADVINRIVSAAPGAPIDELIAAALNAYAPGSVEMIRRQIEAVKAQQQVAVEPSALELRRIVADGLTARGWTHDDQFCNPFTGLCVDQDAELADLLYMITEDKSLSEKPLTLANVIESLIGAPATQDDDPDADLPEYNGTPGSMYELIERVIRDSASGATTDSMVDAVLQEKSAPLEWETDLRGVIRQRIEETIADRRAGGGDSE